MKIEVEIDRDTGSALIRSRLKQAIGVIIAKPHPSRYEDDVMLAALQLVLRYYTSNSA
jgi:hypothetical protein